MSYFDLNWIDKFFKDRIPNIIFDVGSYNAADAMRFEQYCKDSRIFAFEACPRNYSNMLLRIKRSNSKVTPIHSAVCNIDGQVEFNPTTVTKAGSGSILKPTKLIYKFEGMKFTDPIIVNSTRLDTFCRKMNLDHIDIIHMDIQGAEYLALLGLGELRPRMIFLEVGAIALYEGAKPTSDLLKELGYIKQEIPIKGDELHVISKYL